MSDMKNEIMHGPIGSPFEACPYDISPSGGNGIKGGENVSPFSQWKQAGSELPITVKSNIPYSGTGSLVTPMDEQGAGIPGVTGSSGTGGKTDGGISTPYVPFESLKG